MQGLFSWLSAPEVPSIEAPSFGIGDFFGDLFGNLKMPKIPGIQMPGIPKLNLPKKIVTLLGFATAILLGIVIYVSTGSAQIIIKPRINPLRLDIRVGVSDSYQDVDAETKKIPGQLFSVDKNIEESFPATGERDVAQKARGKITVYNEYGTTPQVLVATTRFESENGLIFHTLTTITIPGTTVKNGKITPGTIKVDIIADKAGDAYNISAGKFTIPAFQEKGDSDRYQKFYGTSKETMRGGIIGKAKVITEQDYISAKKKMEEIISARLEDIFELIEAHLKKIGRDGLLPAGIVITGGGGEIGSIADLAKSSLELPSRIASINFGEAASFAASRDAMWSVAYGLCIFGFTAKNDPLTLQNIAKIVKDRILGLFKQFLP